jgi:glycine/D-amino acid oxidase-like deaminating enzyme
LRLSALAGGGTVLAGIGLNQLGPLIWHAPLPLEPIDSYWARSQAPQGAPLDKDLSVDVAVVGGGQASYVYNNGPGNADLMRAHVEQLGQELGRLYRSLAGTRFAQAWSGVIDYSLDASPSVGAEKHLRRPSRWQRHAPKSSQSCSGVRSCVPSMRKYSGSPR